jgi:hypothetical protein
MCVFFYEICPQKLISPSPIIINIIIFSKFFLSHTTISSWALLQPKRFAYNRQHIDDGSIAIDPPQASPSRMLSNRVDSSISKL